MAYMNFDMTTSTAPRIRKIVMRRSGTYNNMYLRPYDIHVTQTDINSITSQLEQGRGVPSCVTPAMMVNAAPNMFRVSAAPEGNGVAAFIPNGWDERRIMFYINVEVPDITGAVTEYDIHGYTDYNGIGNTNVAGIVGSNPIDPEMIFYVNDIQVRRVSQTQYGPISGVVDSDTCIYKGPYEGQNQYMIRPTDICGSTMLTNEIYDTRPNVRSDVEYSRKENALPSNYGSNMIKSVADSCLHGDFGEVDLYQCAMDTLRENSAMQNKFLLWLSNVARTYGGVGVSGNFRWRDLVSLDPDLANPACTRVQFIEDGYTQMPTHSVGWTSDWMGSTIETVYATTIANAVSAIMPKCLLSFVAFNATNQILGDTSTTGIMTTIATARTVDGSPVEIACERFKQLLEIELKNLSYNNEQKFVVGCTANVYGETRISVSIDGSQEIEFAAPTFCDRLTTPVLTMDQSRAGMLSDSVKTLFDTVHDVVLQSQAMADLNNRIITGGYSSPPAMQTPYAPGMFNY